MNAKLAAALASGLWGFTYVISTGLLPDNPMFIAAVRALGGGIGADRHPGLGRRARDSEAFCSANGAPKRAAQAPSVKPA
jgi:drug/metabolite transporter (DMT)-like permease